MLRGILMKWSLVVLVAANILLALAAFYGVFGAFWVWQPGTSPYPSWVPLFGSQSYLASLKAEGLDCSIVYEVLSYRISYVNNVGQVFGPAIFDWTQFFILLLVIIDVGALVYFLKPRIMK